MKRIEMDVACCEECPWYQLEDFGCDDYQHDCAHEDMTRSLWMDKHDYSKIIHPKCPLPEKKNEETTGN